MRLLFVLCLFASSTAWARDFKIVGQEFMPLQGVEGGKLVGAYVVATKKMCDILKYNCTFEGTPNGRIFEMMKAGEAQMMLGVGVTPERQAIAYFPEFMSQSGYTFFVKKGQAGKFKALEDFKGKNVGVSKGSASHKDLDAQNAKLGGAIKVVEELVVETAPRKLAGGRYGDDGAIYCARPVCSYMAKKENLEIEPVAFDTILQNHTAAVSKAGVKEDEYQQIKKALKEAMKSPEVIKAFADYGLTIHPDMK